VVASEQGRPDIARRRAQWRKYQGRIDPARLVFIDEIPAFVSPHKNAPAISKTPDMSGSNFIPL
jgi:hypothetical protein